ncbi:MAG TPA: hypothetical protein ENG03_01590 [Thioploca sp.]|nr:MAG: hypothetical protein B6247_00905 [Beggiatoa sp. 4572_84]RKZ63774.1 MAG: hypothetical protein DRR08_02665 [Gammaproteobacteria bacterium]HDN25793.1 hypothetical protein [Thioploca sp.]
MKTIYQLAKEAMTVEIERYLNLLNLSNGLENVQEAHLLELDTAKLFAAGIGVEFLENDSDLAKKLIEERRRKSAVPFDVEQAVTMGVYNKVRLHVITLFEVAEQLTNGFTTFDTDTLHQNSVLLPIFQNILALSKAQLKKKVGAVSDTGFSKPSAARLAELLKNTVKPHQISKTKILQRLEMTMEGIVRDLVGRILFEEIVAHALSSQEVQYMRESEYSSLTGVIYDFRADFVIPEPDNPVAFIEVRKSSSRHASLYAKDKMFSALNWKGKHKRLIGVMIVEGDWTQATLQTMAKVFDYVVPLNKCTELAQILKRATQGDESVLKWLVKLSIQPSKKFAQSIKN